MLRLLDDARRVPRIFFPFGAIPEPELTGWLKHNALVLPNELLELWQLTGAAMSSSRKPSFAQPFARFRKLLSLRTTSKAAMQHSAKGKPSELYIFQQGLFLSAVRLSDQKFVTLSEDYGLSDCSPLLTSGTSKLYGLSLVRGRD